MREPMVLEDLRCLGASRYLASFDALEYSQQYFQEAVSSLCLSSSLICIWLIVPWIQHCVAEFGVQFSRLITFDPAAYFQHGRTIFHEVSMGVRRRCVLALLRKSVRSYDGRKQLLHADILHTSILLFPETHGLLSHMDEEGPITDDIVRALPRYLTRLTDRRALFSPRALSRVYLLYVNHRRCAHVVSTQLHENFSLLIKACCMRCLR
jgi:hypothetical protein